MECIEPRPHNIQQGVDLIGCPACKRLATSNVSDTYSEERLLRAWAAMLACSGRKAAEYDQTSWKPGVFPRIVKPEETDEDYAARLLAAGLEALKNA